MKTTPLIQLAPKKSEANATDDAKLSVKKGYPQTAEKPIDQKGIVSHKHGSNKNCPPIVVLKQQGFQKNDCLAPPVDEKNQQARDVQMKTCSAGEEVSKGSGQVNSVVKSLVEEKTQKSVEDKKQKSVEDKTQKSTEEGLESQDPKTSTRSQ
uniref:Uncharacterized protein n=1 Tax=Ditylenchus dipsaci TaxID=166011 RepID=A0A915EGK6_9BILA